MPFAIVLLVVNITLIVHAAKTGRFSPWGYIILFVPFFGGLAYVVAELIPAWFGSVQGQKARKHVTIALDPERRYRELSAELEAVDTVSNRLAVAEECLALGKYWVAEDHYKSIMARPQGDEPLYWFGLARAQFGGGRAQDTIATLDDLRSRWPDYQSAEGHLLYARALEGSDRLDEALVEYQAVANYFPGLEARVRYGILLDQRGRKNDAQAIFGEVLRQTRHAPKHVRKAQAEWIALAEKGLRA